MRKSFTKSQYLRIGRRDSSHCRYCLTPIFFAQTLKLLNDLAPGHSLYHRNGAEKRMLALYRLGWASLDHIIPVTGGGSNNDENLVASCWGCNNKKGDNPSPEVFPLKEIPSEIADLAWDGMSSLYPKLLGDTDGWTKLISGA